MRSEVEKLFGEVAKSRRDRTAEKAFTILSALFNFSSTDEVNGVRILTSNPCDVIKVKKLVRRSNPKERFLSKAEIARLHSFYYVEMDWPETKPHGVTKQGIHYFLLLLHTGLRRSEAFKLRWEDVDWQGKIVTVRATKNGTNHRFPMSTGTLHILKQQQLIAGKSEWVFPSTSSVGHMTEPKSQLEKLKQATNLDFCLHDLRRTFETHAQAAGMDFALIQQALNHKSGGGVTRQYIISQMEILQKVFQAVSQGHPHSDRKWSSANPHRRSAAVELQAVKISYPCSPATAYKSTPIIVSFMLSSFSVSVDLITTNVGTLMPFGEGRQPSHPW